ETKQLSVSSVAGFGLARLQLPSLLIRDLKAGVGCGDSSVDCRLQKCFFHVAGLHAVLECRANVQAKFFPASKRRHHRQHQKAARTTIKARTSPDRSPGISRDELLEFARKIIGCSHSPIHVGAAQNLAAHLHPFLERITWLCGEKKIEHRSREGSRK